MFSWKMILGLAYGFFTIPIIVAGIGLVVAACSGSGWLYTRIAVSSADYWAGLWGFVGVAILAIVIVIRLES